MMMMNLTRSRTPTLRPVILLDLSLVLTNASPDSFVIYAKRQLIAEPLSHTKINKLVRPRWPYDMRPSVHAEKYMCFIVIR